MRQPARLWHVARASCPLGQGRPARAPSWPGRPCHRERSAGPALRPCGTSGLRRAWARRTGKFRWAKAEPSLEKPAGKAARLESEPCATFCRVACATGPATHTPQNQLSAELKVKTRGAERCSALRKGSSRCGSKGGSQRLYRLRDLQGPALGGRAFIRQAPQCYSEARTRAVSGIDGQRPAAEIEAGGGIR